MKFHLEQKTKKRQLRDDRRKTTGQGQGSVSPGRDGRPATFIRAAKSGSYMKRRHHYVGHPRAYVREEGGRAATLFPVDVVENLHCKHTFPGRITAYGVRVFRTGILYKTFENPRKTDSVILFIYVPVRNDIHSDGGVGQNPRGAQLGHYD